MDTQLSREESSKESKIIQPSVQEKNTGAKSFSSGTEVCDEQPFSERQSMEITRQRPHSLQLGASSQDDTKPSATKSPHTNKRRTVTRAPPSFRNLLSPINEEGPDMMFNENDVKYEESYDSVVIKTDDETFQPRPNAEGKIKLMRWDNILDEIDREIAKLRPPRTTSKNNNRTADSSESHAVLDESYEDLLSIEKPRSIFESLSFTYTTTVTMENAGDESVKEKSFELSLMPEEVILWQELAESRGDDVNSPDLLIWSTVVELAAMLWPESSEKLNRISSELLPIPESVGEFAEMAERYMTEKLSCLPPSHRYKLISRPWLSDDTGIFFDEAVAQHVYGWDPNSVNFVGCPPFDYLCTFKYVTVKRRILNCTFDMGKAALVYPGLRLKLNR
ncbi:unnamed protein product [Angiostrongylus costaricensis]|uniref:ELM2 domain-containing protein n=1 Tax=Angiostrongylus costaricensis TaxID=334426 RepID=A0A158PMM0_ANGCS|nr:unnamed protein product [Angiostrongylus costaricensis]